MTGPARAARSAARKVPGIPGRRYRSAASHDTATLGYSIRSAPDGVPLGAFVASELLEIDWGSAYPQLSRKCTDLGGRPWQVPLHTKRRLSQGLEGRGHAPAAS